MVSVAIDVLMKCSPGFRASGSDRKMASMGKSVIIHSPLTFPPKARDESVGTDLLFGAIFSIDAAGPEIW